MAADPPSKAQATFIVLASLAGIGLAIYTIGSAVKAFEKPPPPPPG
ncbi:MAG: hypothetical protein ACREB9_03755 [Thermoplasmata archaeon]